MEKDFKKEYSEHMKSETPDLWARIDSGLVEKTPATKIRKFNTRKWMKALPAAAAVVLLVAVAPVFMPKGAFESMEKSAMDMAFFDGKADNAAPECEYGMQNAVAEEEMVVEESVPETFITRSETNDEAKNEMPVESAGGTAGSATTSNSASGEVTGTATDNGDAYDYTSKKENQQLTTEQDKANKDEIETIEIKVLHLQVLEKTQDMNLLAIDKEHIGMVCDLYLVEVDGEEKVLAVPSTEEEVVFELGVWYDLTVTDAEEYGIDYIWVK